MKWFIIEVFVLDLIDIWCFNILLSNKQVWSRVQTFMDIIYREQIKKLDWTAHFIGVYKFGGAVFSCSNPACIGLYLQSK